MQVRGHHDVRPTCCIPQHLSIHIVAEVKRHGVKRLGHQTVLLSANHSNSNPAKPKGSDAGSHHAMADHPLKATPIGSKYRVITVQRTSIEPRRPATHKLKRSIASLASAPSFQL